MSEEVDTFCRLCAEPTPQDQLISADDDVGMNSKVAAKMLWLNIEISPTNLLPNTICFSCFDLLERTWSFLHNVRTAQQKLKEIYTKKFEGENSTIDFNVDVNNAGKPIDEDWNDFQEVKKEVKNEISSDDDLQISDAPSILIDLDSVKSETKNETTNHEIDSDDSDLPLQVHNKIKKLKKNKRKHSEIHAGNDTIEFDDLNTNFLIGSELDIKVETQSDADYRSGLDSGSDMPLLKKRKIKKKKPKMKHTLKENKNCKSWGDYMCHCADCDAQCKNIASLRIHSLQIHKKCCLVKCSDCGKNTSKFVAFVNHARYEHNLLKYCCEYCNDSFQSHLHLRNHKKSSHYNVLSCKNCGAIFETEELLRDHESIYAKHRRRRKIKKEAEFELKCELCQKQFKTQSSLYTHRLLHTERRRDFSCHVCGKMFFTKGSLSTHILIHEDTKRFKCESCPLTFRTRGNLAAHISLHSGVKPFVCEQCGKSFRVKRHLKSHSIMHTDLRPYVCEYCNKSFRFKTRLNLHLRQHTGAKPYNCVYCQRDFTNGSNYKKHMRRRHAIDTSGTKNYKNNVVNDTTTVENIEKSSA